MARQPAIGHHETFVPVDDGGGSSDRAFGLVFGTALAVIAFLPVIRGGSPRVWLLPLALAFVLIAILHARTLAPFNRAWSKLGLLLHRLVSPVIMALVFYLVFTPVGVVSRRFRDDLLGIRFDPNAPSYWAERETRNPADLRKQY